MPMKLRKTALEAQTTALLPFNPYFVIQMALEGVVVRNNKKLVKMLYLPYLHCQILAAFGIHVGCGLIKKRDSDIR